MPGTEMDWLETRNESEADMLAKLLRPHVYEDHTVEIMAVDEAANAYEAVVTNLDDSGAYRITVSLV
jgi:hypothetical protein